jgi:radical SAM protein with 4Fe4S-binding SPASM domain
MNLIYRRTRPWSMPIHMQVELSSQCDLACPVCPAGRGLLKRPGQMMDLDLYARLMEDVGGYLLAVCLWGWGEPLLHPRFAEAVRIARRHGVLPVISTNGQNLDEPRVLEDLIRQPPEYLIVAIDGLTEQTNARYRIGASLAKTLTGVRRLAETRRRRGQTLPRLNMRFIVMKHNEHELPDVPAFARDNGFDLLTIRTLSIIDDRQDLHRELIPQEEGFRAYEYRDGRRVRRADFICQHAFCFPAVLADGTVVACDQDYGGAHAYGRLGRGASFADIWFAPGSKAIRKTIRDHRERFSVCRRCPYGDRTANACSVQAIALSE